MRIQTNIFIWGFFAFLVPLTTLALIATYYSQSNYLDDVEKNVQQNIIGLSTEIERQLSADRALTLGLSQAHTIKEFLSTLDGISQQQTSADFNLQIESVNKFFEGFQTIIPGIFFLRILDNQGNTLIKVSHNKRSLPTYESLHGFSYTEQEINNSKFVAKLKALPKGVVSSIILPHNKAQTNLLNNISLLDNVIPLYHNNKWIGALALTKLGEDIDKILSHAVRPLNGKLLIAENNPDNKKRHGLILYNDNKKLLFSHARPTPFYLQNKTLNQLLDKVIDADNTVFKTSLAESSLYSYEFSPYPSQFVSWFLSVDIPNATINQPYSKIRLTIWGVAAFTLWLGLILTQIGAKQVTRALSSLVINFKEYAQGDHKQIANTEHCADEIKDLGDAFNDMTNTLNLARKERNKAQQMVLQNSKLASIGQMAAGIGHEINNPLNNILSYAKLALRNIDNIGDNNLDPAIKKTLTTDLQSLREESLRASEIVKGIMNFARQVPPQFSEFELKPWIENSLTLVQQTANDHQVILKLDYPSDLSAVFKGDRGQLQQVMVNLLLNAIQASKKNSGVNIIVSEETTSSENKHSLLISIIDNGPGINTDDLNLVFDPFFTTKEQGQGTGLGLSISLGIIQDHQGTLTIENRTDTHGIIAKITLPF